MNSAEESCETSDRNLFALPPWSMKRMGSYTLTYQANFPSSLSATCRISLLGYAYKPNAIIVQSMKSRDIVVMVGAYKENYKYLEAKGFKPKLNVTDNECSKWPNGTLKAKMCNGN